MDREPFDIIPGSNFDCDDFVAHGGERRECHLHRLFDFLDGFSERFHGQRACERVT